MERSNQWLSQLHTAKMLSNYGRLPYSRANTFFLHGTYRRCLGANVKLEIVDKTGHVPQMEDPDRFNKVVLDFLLASQKPSSTQHAQ